MSRVLNRNTFVRVLFFLNTFFPAIAIKVLTGMQVFSSDSAYTVDTIGAFAGLIFLSSILAYLMTRATRSYELKDLFYILGITFPILLMPLAYFLLTLFSGEIVLALTVGFFSGLFFTLVGSPAIALLIFCNLWLGKKIFNTFKDHNDETTLL